MKDRCGKLINRMDFVCNNGQFYLVTLSGEDLELWDYQAWLKGFYDAYIPLKDYPTMPNGYSKLVVIGNFKDNPELLPSECEGYNGEPNVECVGTIFRNPKFNPEYANPHSYEHSIGYPKDEICVCGKIKTDIIHELEVEIDTLK